MSLKTIDAREAKTLADSGALFVDVREPNEFAAEHIPGSQTHPLSRMRNELPVMPNAGKVVFLCQSGARTGANAQALRDCADCEAYILEGGLSAWKKAGLPVESTLRQPISIMRQVLMVAGTLVLTGFVLGLVFDPAWHILSAFVGGGLAFAGVTDICPMAKVLNKMPWNRMQSPKTGMAGSGTLA